MTCLLQFHIFVEDKPIPHLCTTDKRNPMFSNCLSVHGVPIEAERSQSSSKTLKDSLICILAFIESVKTLLNHTARSSKV